jgi:hypothetical protein
MSSSPSLIVVRGAYRGTDAAYACTAHDARPGRYVMLEVDEGRVLKRTIVPAADRRVVEDAMRSYRGVYVDRRTDAGLLPLEAPAHALDADLNALRRAKSDAEIEALCAARDQARDALDAVEAPTASTFRGAAAQEGYKSSFEVTRAKGFTQYRGGVQDALGRCSDQTRVEARTPAWEARLARAYRGLDAVRGMLRPGVKVDDLDRAFMSHMDPDQDVVYGSVVHHTGFESHEDSLPLDRLERYDFLTLGVAVGDGKETALLYRGAEAVDGQDVLEEQRARQQETARRQQQEEAHYQRAHAEPPPKQETELQRAMRALAVA